MILMRTGTATILALCLVALLDPRAVASAAGQAARPGDFNGDGFVDLAIGLAGPTRSMTDAEAGAVDVLYGSPAGVGTTGAQRWSQDSPGIQGTAEADDRFGSALVTADFDRDGFADLAIGVVGDEAVQVLYGSAGGLTADGDQYWTLETAGVEGDRGYYDRFGTSLAAGDFDHDGFADLAIGAPGERAGGAVHVLYGSPWGVTAGRDQLWSQDSPSVQGVAEAKDEFGARLAVGDFDADGYADLAIGAPGETILKRESAGTVNVLYGSGHGLSAARDQVWSQATDGIAGTAEAWDGFGSALSTGDFDRDGYADLAIGVPSEDFGGLPELPGRPTPGVVQVIRGSSHGLTASGDRLWSQDSPGVKGAIGRLDRFGAALASGDFDHDGFTDLAIGAPGDTVSGLRGAGAVNLLTGSASGLSAARDQLWTQDTRGVEDVAESSDCFGIRLAIGDFDRDGHADLAVGNPCEGFGPSSDWEMNAGWDLGGVEVLLGRSSGLTAGGDQYWREDSPGLPQPADAGLGWGDSFGYAVAP